MTDPFAHASAPPPRAQRPSRPSWGRLTWGVLVWPIYLLVVAVIMVLLPSNIAWGAAVGLFAVGIARAILGNANGWLAIVAIPVGFGVVLPLVMIDSAAALATADKVTFQVVEFTESSHCSLREVGSDRTIEFDSCRSDGASWDEGQRVDFYVGGALDADPTPADRLDGNYSWVQPMFVISFLVGLLLRIRWVWVRP